MLSFVSTVHILLQSVHTLWKAQHCLIPSPSSSKYAQQWDRTQQCQLHLAIQYGNWCSTLKTHWFLCGPHTCTNSYIIVYTPTYTPTKTLYYFRPYPLFDDSLWTRLVSKLHSCVILILHLQVIYLPMASFQECTFQTATQVFYTACKNTSWVPKWNFKRIQWEWPNIWNCCFSVGSCRVL